MKIAKTWIILSLLLLSMVIGVIPSIRAENQDSYGYTYKDSNTSGGPTYDWIEISSTGTQVFPSYDVTAPIGFDFNYYGWDYSQIQIYSFGMIGLEGHNLNEGQIMPFLDVNGLYCNIYYETRDTAPNRMFIVQWAGIQTVNGSSVTYEAIFYEGTNNIKFQYQDVIYENLWLSPHNNGGLAKVGIVAPYWDEYLGLIYSCCEPVLSAGLAIEFYLPPVLSEANLYASIIGPPRTSTISAGEIITYTVSFSNLGNTAVSDAILVANLSQAVNSMNFLSASDDGSYDSEFALVTWNIGDVDAYPMGYGSRTVTIELPISQTNSEIFISVKITSSATESDYTDNNANILTQVAGLNLPESVEIQSEQLTADVAGTPIVRNTESTTFTYNNEAAIAVDISILLSDGGPEITGSMIGPAPMWTYTLTFGDRIGNATVEFIAHYLIDEEEINEVAATANIEILRVDPAGYIYDVATLERIAGATVWLQMPNGRGAWMNVPIHEDADLSIMDPNINPQITGIDGRYKWDTISGTYRVSVIAPGYYPSDSIAVTVPPPVTDLHVGLTKIPLENSSPVVQAISTLEYPVQVDSPISFSAIFTDSNTLDLHYGVWSWGDESKSKGVVKESNGVGTVTGNHIYTNAGVYTATLTVSDNNGGASEISTQQYIVVYNPNAGFVTGGGWINSPPGAFSANPALTGKANFGFVSKYEKGANVPTGNTEFDFKVANMNFHSTLYDWLVIAGTKAQYKGQGTVNGFGNYKFMLTAEDGGKTLQDTFRIKIWDATTDVILYDNGAQTPLNGGSIIIHN